MSRKEDIESAYRSLGSEATLYDGMITCSTLLGKLVCGLVWNMGKEKNTRFSRQGSCLSGDLSGAEIRWHLLRLLLYSGRKYANGLVYPKSLHTKGIFYTALRDSTESARSLIRDV